jgi:hypothetical protein
MGAQRNCAKVGIGGASGMPAPETASANIGRIRISVCEVD